MTEQNRTVDTCSYDLGTFEGFNFRNQSAIPKTLTADEVFNWDHDAHGEAEFWPAGDVAGVALIFKGQNAVTASEISALHSLLNELGGDSPENYLRIYYSVSMLGERLGDVDASKVEDQAPMIYWGDSFCDVRKEAAYELFETYYPELYRIWESTPCDGFSFDVDQFLDSPQWSTEEVKFDGRAALLISPQ
jgi:hypothetical protein